MVFTAVGAARFICWKFGLAVDVMQYLFPSPPGWTAGRLLSCTLAGSALDPSQAYCACLIVGACRLGSISGWPLYDTGRPLAASLITAALTAFLTPPALRYTGRISYGLYLYHVPVFLTGKDCAPRSRRRPDRPDRVELRRCGNLIRVRREAVLEAKRTGSTERRRWLSRRRYFGGKVEAV
jgi:peptidoglycan/LPS O-acetylase OafA/YrhL